MKVVIISSIIDPASENIKQSLLNKSKWESIDYFDDNPVYKNSVFKDVFLVTINTRKIFRENLDKEINNKLSFNPDLAIFISKHTSEMKKPTLSVHPVGNYGDAEFGGRPKTIVKSSPILMTNLLRLMKKNYKLTNLEYQVCFEVTHHGPYLEIPTFFAEIGSTEKEWKDKNSANIIASSILELIGAYLNNNSITVEVPVLFGIGGGHYAPRFTDVIFEKNAVFGHMIPSYQINAGNINGEILEKAIEATPNITGIYIHKKALKKSQISELKNWFNERDFSIISSKELSPLS